MSILLRRVRETEKSLKSVIPINKSDEELGMSETSSFISETSSEFECESSEEEINTLDDLDHVNIHRDEEVSKRESYDDSYSYSLSSSQPRKRKFWDARDFMMTQASLNGFIVSDGEFEEEEEEMNSSDRAFIASSCSSIANDSITMYRLIDRSQRWRPIIVESSSTCSSQW